MPRQRRARFVALVDLLARRRPDVDRCAINEGRVLVDGRFVTNPRAMVRADASVRVTPVRRLRGDVKLSSVLRAFSIVVSGRVAVDVGASAGGFTTALLDHCARRVYAVDAGVGQLQGRLRRDPRVVPLDGHNLGALDTSLIPDTIDIVTMDLSYLPVSEAVPQLERLDIGAHADLVALVKPTFELRRATLAASADDLADAVDHATAGITACGWTVVGHREAPATGQRGAREAFVHAVADR